MKSTDIRISVIRLEYDDLCYRTPIKFGGVTLDRATLLNVYCDVESRSGKTATGFGSMPLGNGWAYPSKQLTYEQTLAAMKALAERVAAIAGAYREYGHPIDITWALEPVYLKAASELSQTMSLSDRIPPLAVLVAASPFDAALHDAFGKVHGLNCYSTYGPDFLENDLGHYLGHEYAGLGLHQFIDPKPKPRMPIYHLVGALDPLTPHDVRQPVGDGLPETLGQWIHLNGLDHLKIKLHGEDIDWDVERVTAVQRVTEEEQANRHVEKWYYSLDFNEKCGSVGYLLEFLQRIQQRSPGAFQRIQYIEQPTRRDLQADRANVMHEASNLRPVVIDEALVDLESLRLGKKMGYTGVALKACKGQTQTLLLAAAAKIDGMFLCVQDLTCPGASLIQSAGIAAHIPGIAAIEANARQYCPSANEPWAAKFPGIFNITDGTMETGLLTGVGLGASL